MNVHVFNAFRHACSPLLSLLYRSASTSLGLSAKSNPFLTSNVLIISAPQTTTSLESPILTPYTGPCSLPHRINVSANASSCSKAKTFPKIGSPRGPGGKSFGFWWSHVMIRTRTNRTRMMEVVHESINADSRLPNENAITAVWVQLKTAYLVNGNKESRPF